MLVISASTAKKHRNSVRLIGYQQLHQNTCLVYIPTNFSGKEVGKKTDTKPDKLEPGARGVSKVIDCAWLKNTPS